MCEKYLHELFSDSIRSRAHHDLLQVWASVALRPSHLSRGALFWFAAYSRQAIEASEMGVYKLALRFYQMEGKILLCSSHEKADLLWRRPNRRDRAWRPRPRGRIEMSVRIQEAPPPVGAGVEVDTALFPPVLLYMESHREIH